MEISQNQINSSMMITVKKYFHDFSYKIPFLNSFIFVGLMSRVFANGLGDLGSIPGRVMLRTQKIVLDATLFNTQHYKVRIKSKVEQSREWSCTVPYTLV